MNTYPRVTVSVKTHKLLIKEAKAKKITVKQLVESKLKNLLKK